MVDALASRASFARPTTIDTLFHRARPNLKETQKGSEEKEGGMTSFKRLVLLLLIGLSPSTMLAQARPSGANTPSGSMCIASVTPPNSEQKSLSNPAGGNPISSYSVQIDKRKPVITSNDKSISISGLAVGRRHLVKIFGDGRPIESFGFRFSGFSTTKLCLWFNTLYETWQLWDARDGGAKCRCNR